MTADLQRVAVLGSTGSIGVSTLDVIARHPNLYRVFALTANTSVETMLQQCKDCEPDYAVMLDAQSAQQLQQALSDSGVATQVLAGLEGLCRVASDERADIVMAAIVGAAGLEPTLAAARAGKKVLLANKESLVMAGKLFMDTVVENAATLLPIDSEHNAIFQCLRADSNARPSKAGMNKILLTASGGPFREWSLADMEQATPDQACAHPNWDMGRKISVDSATLMNKGLELIEACWLFDVTQHQVEVVVHPQSIVHSMVQYVDGSVLAELGNPDMRTPIAYGLAWPERIGSGVADLDIIGASKLDFSAPDVARFPCLDLARQVVSRGGTAAAVLNAANEVAVTAFLEEEIGFTDIAGVISAVLEIAEITEPDSLAVVKTADENARQLARQVIEKLNR
jgi:1-deoxy-D-xylulose-5-phosphate reductoisomerase